MCELPNIKDVRSAHSNKHMIKMEGDITLSKVLNALEEITTNMTKIEARITRIETDNRNFQD